MFFLKDPTDDTGRCKYCKVSPDDNIELFESLTVENEQLRKDLVHEVELNIAHSRTHKNLHTRIAILENANRIDKETIRTLWEEIHRLRAQGRLQ